MNKVPYLCHVYDSNLCSLKITADFEPDVLDSREESGLVRNHQSWSETARDDGRLCVCGGGGGYRNKQMCVFFCSEQRRRAQLSFPNSRLFILPSDQSSVIASARKTGP